MRIRVHPRHKEDEGKARAMEQLLSYVLPTEEELQRRALQGVGDGTIKVAWEENHNAE